MDRDTSTWTFQSAAVATGNGQIMDVTGLAAVAVQITGITTATIAFEANVDKTNWVAVQAVNLNDGSVGSTATADGLYLVSTTGLKQLRCRVSAWTAGTITVIGNGVMNAAGLTLADVDIAGTETVTANQGTAHASEKWRVSVIDALPAGTNAIGKLATNSGVDIGDVDVLSITAGETHIGEVGGRVAVVAVTPTITAGAYHAGDVIGGIITLTGAARVSGGGTTLTKLSVLDAANQKAQIEALFFNANPASSTFTDNAAPVIHASDETKYIGKLTLFASDYLTVGAKAVACLTNLGLAVVPSGSANLFMVLIAPGTPTYAATTDLKLTLAFYQE